MSRFGLGKKPVENDPASEAELNPEVFNVFNQKILTHLEPVWRQSKSGDKWLKRTLSLLEDTREIQEGYAQKLVKAIEHQKKKIKEDDDDEDKTKSGSDSVIKKGKLKIRRDQMNRTWMALMALYSSVTQLANCHESLSWSLAAEVIAPLQKFYKVHHEQYKNLDKEASAAVQSLSSNFSKVTKLKYKALAAVQSRQEMMAPEAERKKKGILSSMRMALGSSDLDARVEVTKRQYQEAIAQANEAQKEFYRVTLPAIQKKFETIETSRMNHMSKFLRSYIRVLKRSVSDLNILVKHLEDGTITMDSAKDIKDFAGYVYDLWSVSCLTFPSISKYGNPRIPDPLRDEILVWDVNSIVEEHTNLNDLPNFGTPLKDVIATQRKVTELSGSIPQFVINMILVIRSSDDYYSTNVFDAFPDIDQVLEARKKFYLLNSASEELYDPYVAWELLKQWLDELPDSLLGKSYDGAIDLISEGGSVEDVKHFWDNAPLNLESRNLVQYLLDFLHEISTLEHLDFTDILNIFAPLILKPEGEEDFLIRMQNSGYEVMFLRRLMEALYGASEAFAPPSCDASFFAADGSLFSLSELDRPPPGIRDSVDASFNYGRSSASPSDGDFKTGVSRP